MKNRFVMELADERLFFHHLKLGNTVDTSFSSRVNFIGKVNAERDFVRNCFSEVYLRRTGDKKAKMQRV